MNRETLRTQRPHYLRGCVHFADRDGRVWLLKYIIPGGAETDKLAALPVTFPIAGNCFYYEANPTVMDITDFQCWVALQDICRESDMTDRATFMPKPSANQCRAISLPYNNLYDAGKSVEQFVEVLKKGTAEQFCIDLSEVGIYDEPASIGHTTNPKAVSLYCHKRDIEDVRHLWSLWAANSGMSD